MFSEDRFVTFVHNGEIIAQRYTTASVLYCLLWQGFAQGRFTLDEVNRLREEFSKDYPVIPI